MSQLILRDEALRHCRLFEDSRYTILMIQAQAGQGKTVLATQFDEASKTPFAWVTCTRHGNSPRKLFESILDSMTNVLTELKRDAVLEVLNQQLVDDELIDIAASRLQVELEDMREPVCLVVDDAHLLEDAESTKRLLRRLTEVSPDFVKYLFVTRFPLTLDGEPLFAASEVMRIDKSLLAFTREEIAILYNDVLGEPAGTRKINQFYEATEGWISGLKLLHSSGTIRRLVHADSTSLGPYFDELLLPSLTRSEYREMHLLALLEELPAPLLRDNASSGVNTWIRELVDKNCFARRSRGEKETIFRLHHIFQEYLTSQAEPLLTNEEREQFLLTIGDWYLDHGREKEGLRCFVKARNWDRMASAMQSHCLPLLALHHHHLLMDILEEVPQDIVHNSPWICFAYGATRLLMAPAECAPALERALHLFRSEGDAFGELLACSSLLNFHVLISGDFRGKAILADRAASLFRRQESALPPAIAASCAQAISLGRVYYEGNLVDGAEYVRLSDLYSDAKSDSNPWAILTKILILGLSGEVESALDKLSLLFPLVNSPWASPTNRFSLLIVQVNYLLMAGRMREYKALSAEIRNEWKQFLDQSYLGTFLTVWDLDVMLAEQQYAEMVRKCERFIATTPNLPPHILSQVKHYEMIAYAHLGRKKETIEAMQNALRIRAKGGGPYFIHLTQSLAMAALSLIGHERSAKRIYDKRTRPMTGAPSLHHSQLPHTYMAALYLRENKPDKAIEPVRNALEFLSKTGNLHFFGWSQYIMKPVLSFAVRENIHREQARKLAWWRLNSDILDDGTLIPLMSIRILGDISVSRCDKGLKGADLSPAWRQVLSMLALTPGHELDIRIIQNALWPEQDPEKSRSKFDTMLSRMRSKFSRVFGKDASKCHLQVKAQRLGLHHCLFDCDMVEHYAKEGTAYAEADRPWQAHNAFVVMSEWLAPAINSSPPSLAPTERMVRLTTEALGRWLDTLMKAGALGKALQVAEKALALDPLNDGLHRRRYNLLTTLKRPSEAALCLREYRKVLLDHDFAPDDIDTIVDNLLADAQ